MSRIAITFAYSVIGNIMPADKLAEKEKVIFAECEFVLATTAIVSHGTAEDHMIDASPSKVEHKKNVANDRIFERSWDSSIEIV